MSVSKQHILAEIRRLAEANDGTAPGLKKFTAETGINERDWLGDHWVRWSEAVVEAGYTPNALATRYDDDDVLGKLAELVLELGHYPVHGELLLRRKLDPSFPSVRPIRRLGGKQEVAAKLLDFIDRNPEFESIRANCEEVVVQKSRGTLTDDVGEIDDDETDFGYVYLMKSGRFYKIGRSNSVGRRERELAIQLPEKVELVHQISTDDPVGIEAYWHRRFADRRKNGEWFELTREDVKAFRRRKFM